MYQEKILKRPLGPDNISSLITSDVAGLGVKNKELYRCYSDEYIHNWLNSWQMDYKPENFTLEYFSDTSQFDWYINLKEHIIE